jgi:uncharacterized repeat protein (TIGR02543 family)
MFNCNDGFTYNPSLGTCMPSEGVSNDFSNITDHGFDLSAELCEQHPIMCGPEDSDLTQLFWHGNQLPADQTDGPVIINNVSVSVSNYWLDETFTVNIPRIAATFTWRQPADASPQTQIVTITPLGSSLFSDTLTATINLAGATASVVFISETEAELTVTLPAAVIKPVFYSLTTTANPAARGNVARVPAGTGANGSGTGNFHPDGENVVVTATPTTGNKFDGWSGAATGTTNPVTILMDGNKTLTATFSAESVVPPTDGGFSGTWRIAPIAQPPANPWDSVPEVSDAVAQIQGANITSSDPRIHNLTSFTPNATPAAGLTGNWHRWTTDPLLDLENRPFWLSTGAAISDIRNPQATGIPQTGSFTQITVTIDGILYRGVIFTSPQEDVLFTQGLLLQ